MLGHAVVLAQAVAVVANQAFRPTPVLQANLQYTVAVDTSLGGLVVRDLTIPPVTFAGNIRIEGAEPFARAPEARAFDDSVRFEPDGSARLLVADQRGRAPIEVRVEGGAGASGGRIVISAASWPLNRVIVLTVQPFDIHEYLWRGAGHGQRDRLRIDDRRVMAFLTDPTAGGMTVAFGLGRGSRGRMQAEATEVTVLRRYGNDLSPERAQVGGLTVFLEPERDSGAAGSVRAELIFGLGPNEEAAASAAAAAAASPQGGAPAFLLRVNTPEPVIGTLLAQAFAASWRTLAADQLPASLERPYARGPEGARTADLAYQIGTIRTVCNDYVRFRRLADTSGTQRLAIATRLSPRGPYLWVQDDDSVDAESRESAQVLKGYACYRGTRDSTWLLAELPVLRAAARTAGRRSEDPMRPDGFERLADLEEEAARLTGGARPAAADSLRDLARRLRGEPPPTGAAAWRAIVEEATRAVNGRYGRTGPAETGVFLERLVRGLFGVEEHLNEIVIAPRLDGAFDDFTWRLEGWKVWDDTLSFSYRPAAGEATLRLGALHRRRLVLRFPWLSPGACLTVRRGRETERPMLVFTTDGSAYLDIRGAFNPAEVRLTARACAN